MDNPVGSTVNEQVLVTIDNIVLSGTPYAVIVSDPTNIILAGGTTTIASWVLGPVYNPANPAGDWFGGRPLDTRHPTTAMLAGGPDQGYFERSKPNYGSSTADDWLSASILAKGIILQSCGRKFD